MPCSKCDSDELEERGPDDPRIEVTEQIGSLQNEISPGDHKEKTILRCIHLHIQPIYSKGNTIKWFSFLILM